MDHKTLVEHRDLWVQEDQDKRFLGALPNLLPNEQEVFDDLRYDRFGERVRLEQERIAFGWVKEALENVR